jgi:Tfp pilus assembly protein PilV
VEVLLSIAFLSIIVTALLSAITLGEETTMMSGSRMRASLLAEEGLEAARNMRDENFSNLVDGTHGLIISGNQWQFSGTQDITDYFTRQIVISTVDSNTKNIVSTVSWQQNGQRPGTVSVSTRLTNWKYITQQAYNLTLDFSAANLGQEGDSSLLGLRLVNNGLFNAEIDKMQIFWTVPNQNIKEIQFASGIVWSYQGPGTPLSSQTSGTILDIQNHVISAGQSEDIARIHFTGNMKLSDFTITFIMADGSVTTPHFCPSQPNAICP